MRDLEQRERDVEGRHGADAEVRRERGDHHERDLGGAEADRPGRHEGQRLARLGVAEVDPRLEAEAEPGDRADLDEQMRQRAEDDPDGHSRDTVGRGQDQRGPDDGEVVDDRRQRGGREPAPGVEDAGRHRAEREEHRAQQHDPGQLDGECLVGLAEAWGDRGYEPGCRHEDDPAEHEQPDEHQVDDRRYDLPGALGGPVGHEAGHDRDQRRGERSGGDQLEDQVGDAERGEEGVEVRGDADCVDDHDRSDPAEQPCRQERTGHDQARAGQRAARGHGRGSRRARGCASR